MSNPLTNVFTPQVRRVVYVVATLAAAAWGAFEAADEDWRKAVPLFLGALISLTAASNASPTPTVDPGEGGAADVGLILLIAVFVMVLLIFLGWHGHVLH
jgi:hypothetical protein